MTTERIKHRTLLRGFLVIMSATTVVLSQTSNVTTTKCYNVTANDSYVCFTAEKRRDSRLRNWTAAKDYCQTLNGGVFTLPTMLKPLIQFHLTDFLVLNDFTLDSVWIGGRGVSTGWTWVDGTTFAGSIPNPPQPFSAPVAAIGLKEIYDGNFTMGVLSEHNLAKENDGYICQYNVRETNCPGYGVGDPYYSLSSCFVRYEESINWFLARNKCLLRGGDLATLTNTTDAGIKSLLDTLGYTEPTEKTNGEGKQYWIGLRKIRWNWIPGGSEINISYFKDNPTLDNQSFVEDNYLAIDYKQQFAWGIRDASVKLQTICQGGSWTDTPTTLNAFETTAAQIVSLPVWAVGLICGLCGLFYIVSLIVVGIICCKCCGKQASKKREDSESGGRERNSYAPEPRVGDHATRSQQTPTAQTVGDDSPEDYEYPDDEFDDGAYEMPAENTNTNGKVYANLNQATKAPGRGRPR